MSQDEFINKCKLVQDETKYTYEKTVYKNIKSKITVYCKVHEKYFDQSADTHS
jgi:hypothetical protein